MALAMPLEKHLSLGKRCGRRERETDAEQIGVERSSSISPPAFATVEGVPVCRMTWSFAGPRGNAGLGRFVGW
jgi:hypothetical protein